MSDDWTWDDPTGHEPDHGPDTGEPDGLGPDLPGYDDLDTADTYPLDSGDAAAEPGDDLDTGDPFTADALVDEPHDWSADLDPADDAGDPEPPSGDTEPPALSGDPVGAGLVGADPDVDPHADGGGWPAPEFPAALDLGTPPEPVDGPPWTDPSTLGDPAAAGTEPPTAPAGGPEVAELADYAGTGPDAGWDTLAASEDPATAALARFWGPRA